MKKVPYYYSVVRYVHDPIKNEPINVGIIIQSPQEQFIDCLALNNARTKLQKIATSFDIDAVNKYTKFLQDKFKTITTSGSDFFEHDKKYLKEDFLYKFSKEKIGKIQFTEPRGGLCENLSERVKVLFLNFVDAVESVHDEKHATRNKMKIELQNEFKRRNWLLKQRSAMGNIGIEVDAKIKSKKTKVEHVVDFALQNGSLFVMETIDMSRKDVKKIEDETYVSAFKINDLMLNNKSVRGISLISGMEGKEREYKNHIRLLKAYTEVFIYSEPNEREKFIKLISSILK